MNRWCALVYKKCKFVSWAFAQLNALPILLISLVVRVILSISHILAVNSLR